MSAGPMCYSYQPLITIRPKTLKQGCDGTLAAWFRYEKRLETIHEPHFLKIKEARILLLRFPSGKRIFPSHKALPPFSRRLS
jgi:hypothetical protein